MNLNILHVPKCPQIDLGTNEVTTKRLKNLYLHFKVYTYPTPRGGQKIYATLQLLPTEAKRKREKRKFSYIRTSTSHQVLYVHVKDSVPNEITQYSNKIIHICKESISRPQSPLKLREKTEKKYLLTEMEQEREDTKFRAAQSIRTGTQ